MPLERRNRKGRFSLSPDSVANYRRVYVDVFSIAASLSRPEELFASAAEAGLNAVFVIDAWHETHLGLARRYLDLCRRYGLDCRLSEHKPAEVYAAELCDAECAEGCAVLTRDYDAVKAAERCAVLIFSAGKVLEGGGGLASFPNPLPFSTPLAFTALSTSPLQGSPQETLQASSCLSSFP